MNELERLVVVLVAAVEAAGVKLPDEAKALFTTVAARCEAANLYHLTKRGVHALERFQALEQGREPDYAAAEADHLNKHGVIR